MAEWDRVREINERFARGKPSNELDAAGVVLRQFDGLDDRDHGHPWLPCARGSWCANLRDRWAASVVNQDVKALYYNSGGGLVFQADHIRLLCAYSEECAR